MSCLAGGGAEGAGCGEVRSGFNCACGVLRRSLWWLSRAVRTSVGARGHWEVGKRKTKTCGRTARVVGRRGASHGGVDNSLVDWTSGVTSAKQLLPITISLFWAIVRVRPNAALVVGEGKAELQEQVCRTGVAGRAETPGSLPWHSMRVINERSAWSTILCSYLLGGQRGSQPRRRTVRSSGFASHRSCTDLRAASSHGTSFAALWRYTLAFVS